MHRKSLWIVVAGLSLVTTGCSLYPLRPAGIGSRRSECDGGQCSNCTPHWIPTWKYIDCIDNCVTHETGKMCGCRALRQYRQQCGGPVTCDFAAGFVQAYIDLAESRAPLPPNIPPSRYWTAYYRSCAGQPCVEQWYAGYRVGLDDGLQGGVSKFNRVEVRMAGCQ